jgi:hypothetical protein
MKTNQDRTIETHKREMVIVKSSGFHARRPMNGLGYSVTRTVLIASREIAHQPKN